MDPQSVPLVLWVSLAETFFRLTTSWSSTSATVVCQAQSARVSASAVDLEGWTMLRRKDQGRTNRSHAPQYHQPCNPPFPGPLTHLTTPAPTKDLHLGPKDTIRVEAAGSEWSPPSCPLDTPITFITSPYLQPSSLISLSPHAPPFH
ncbi:hypothetical protein AMTR_s00007p00032030 [Amborella trichopoda]|uniref:Uncharacterized protein n=1 Tax=Amborella trichopoda TaxID=13333 RepID=W1PC81_AMBTC|nr:hypothetical protein AMTR_s00007p00032030 [Amborella trichopoda]